MDFPHSMGRRDHTGKHRTDSRPNGTCRARRSESHRNVEWEIGNLVRGSRRDVHIVGLVEEVLDAIERHNVRPEFGRFSSVTVLTVRSSPSSSMSAIPINFDPASSSGVANCEALNMVRFLLGVESV